MFRPCARLRTASESFWWKASSLRGGLAFSSQAGNGTGGSFQYSRRSYRQLASEGWLDLQHGRRATVAHRIRAAVTDRDWIEDFENRIRSLVAQVRSQGIPAESVATELRSMAKVVTQP